MEKDIFEEDPKFGGEEKEAKPKSDISFGKGFSHLLEGFSHLFKGLGHIFLKKFNMNLLILLVLLLAVFFGTWYFLKQPAPEPAVSDLKCAESVLFSSGQKIDTEEISSQCKTTSEEVKKELTELKKTYEETDSNLKIVEEDNSWKITCPELNLSECPVKIEYKNVTETKIYYRCKDGRLVTDEADCKTRYPEITSTDKITADDVTFSIDNLVYSLEGNNSARLLKINYTILNKKETKIMPRIALKMYDTWTSEIAAQEPRFFISHGEILDGEDWIKVSKDINIYIGDRTNKIRFGLQNTLPDPDEEIAAIIKTLE